MRWREVLKVLDAATEEQLDTQVQVEVYVNDFDTEMYNAEIEDADESHEHLPIGRLYVRQVTE